MTMLTLEVAGRRYRAQAPAGIAIAIPLEFDGPQPSHFGAPPARSEAMTSGSFTGDTRRGGSCNARVLTLNPHCNGTHTECVGHLTDDDRAVTVGALVREPLYLAALVTVDPVAGAQSRESAAQPFTAGDRVITRAALAAALRDLETAGNQALVVRTTPNGADKRTRRYEGESPAPFLTLEAARYLVELGVEHLLVDLPSIDRAHDGGLLAAHRIFWGLPEGSRDAALAARPAATITELVYAPDEVGDGLYLMSLQVPAFSGDAAPSRPLLYPATLETDA
jgi:kynurenine formamidase